MKTTKWWLLLAALMMVLLIATLPSQSTAQHGQQITEKQGPCFVHDVDYGWSEIDSLSVYFRDGTQFRIEDDRQHTGWIARQDLPLSGCAELALPLTLNAMNGGDVDQLGQFDDSLDEGFVHFVEFVAGHELGCYPQGMTPAWIAEDGRAIIDLSFDMGRHGAMKLTWHYDSEEGWAYAGPSQFDVCAEEMAWLRSEVHRALQSDFPRQSLRFMLGSRAANWIANTQ